MKHRNAMESVSKLIESPGMPVSAAEIRKAHEDPEISAEEVARWEVNYRID